MDKVQQSLEKAKSIAKNLSRRQLLIAGTGVAGTATLLNKPRDESGPRDPYFLRVQSALFDAGIATATLVIDRARLNSNIDTLMSHLPDGMAYRIVSKSLPSVKLIEHIRDRSGSNRLMTFNEPMLTTLSKEMPEADQLLGKPLPVQAARSYFEKMPGQVSSATRQVQWLIDTPERLKQYSELANEIGQPMRVNIELDIGLHRGGFVPDETLSEALAFIQADEYLRLSGFMGYEPHLASVPQIMGWRKSAKTSAWKKYEQCLATAARIFDATTMETLVRNAAGSPTYRYYSDTSLANEVSAGSCLVKPSHFDTELLAPHAPASFIATPVIKASKKTQLPALEFMDGINTAWDPNRRKTVFVHGGYWKADPIDPPGLKFNSTFGRSSNQEMLNGGRALDVEPDQFVFFRPRQSEAVFLQFGDIAVYDEGEIVDFWPVFPPSA